MSGFERRGVWDMSYHDRLDDMERETQPFDMRQAYQPPIKTLDWDTFGELKKSYSRPRKKLFLMRRLNVWIKNKRRAIVGWFNGFLIRFSMTLIRVNREKITTTNGKSQWQTTKTYRKPDGSRFSIVS